MVWMEQKLIDKCNNDFLLNAIHLFNSLSDEENIGEKEFCDRLEKNMGDAQGYLTKPVGELKMRCNPIVDKSDPNHWRLRLSSKIPVGLTNMERIYLKALLQSKYSAIFFDDDEQAALLAKFDNVPDLPLETLCVTAPMGSSSHSLSHTEIQNIRILLTAIDGKREILYSNRALNGRRYENCRGFPVRIQYTVIDDRFRLSLWSSDENRPVKVNIDRMYDISLTEEQWEHELTPIQMMESRLMTEPIVMELTDNRKTAERVNIAFSVYDTVTEQMTDGRWRVQLYYYNIDLDNIVNSILSFGPNIRVISPPDVVEKIVRRLENPLAVGGDENLVGSGK